MGRVGAVSPRREPRRPPEVALDAIHARDTVVTKAAAERRNEGKQHVQWSARSTTPDDRAHPPMEQFAGRSKAFVHAAVVRSGWFHFDGYRFLLK